MDLPETLRQAAETLTEPWPLAEQQRAAAALSRRYMAADASGAPLIGGDLDAAVYTLLRMPATYAACRAAMAAVKALLPSEAQPRTLLDAGAGTGAGAWAAAGTFPLERACCLERDPYMARAGRALTDGLPQDVRWRSGDLRGGPGGERADLVLASYVLSELRAEDRSEVLRALWEASDSLLLLVEPGTPAAWSGLMEARRQLLLLGARLLAPCPHSGPCPLSAPDWCHFTVRLSRSRHQKLLKNAGVPYEDEKFCYLAVCRTEAPAAAGRVLRHPDIRPGQVTLRLCAGDGAVHSRIVRKREGALYAAARKCGAGDALPPELCFPRGE